MLAIGCGLPAAGWPYLLCVTRAPPCLLCPAPTRLCLWLPCPCLFRSGCSCLLQSTAMSCLTHPHPGEAQAAGHHHHVHLFLLLRTDAVPRHSLPPTHLPTLINTYPLFSHPC